MPQAHCLLCPAPSSPPSLPRWSSLSSYSSLSLSHSSFIVVVVRSILHHCRFHIHPSSLSLSWGNIAIRKPLQTYIDCGESVKHVSVLSLPLSWSQHLFCSTLATCMFAWLKSHLSFLKLNAQVNWHFIPPLPLMSGDTITVIVDPLVMFGFQPLSMNKRRHQVKPEAQAGMYLMQVNLIFISVKYKYNYKYKYKLKHRYK